MTLKNRKKQQKLKSKQTSKADQKMSESQSNSSLLGGIFGSIRRLYDWVLHWADTPYGIPALVVLSFIESVFFPIPPDVLLIAMVLGARSKWFKLALACTIASALGGVAGYALGSFAWDSLSPYFFQYVPGFKEAQYLKIKALYETWDFWIVFAAGFTPIPYKVFTVSSGACNINFTVFVIASVLSRGARFFLVAWLLQRYGAPIKDFIEKKFNLLTMVFMVAILGGFLAIKFVF